MNKIIPVGFLIIALSIGYYFVIFLPSTATIGQTTPNSDVSLENQKICQEAALKLHELEGGNLSQNTTQMEARFKYIPEESLCVYKGGFISPDTIHEYLKDVMTNDTFSEYIIKPSGIVLYGDKESFEKTEAKYFLGVDY